MSFISTGDMGFDATDTLPMLVASRDDYLQAQRRYSEVYLAWREKKQMLEQIEDQLDQSVRGETTDAGKPTFGSDEKVKREVKRRLSAHYSHLVDGVAELEKAKFLADQDRTQAEDDTKHWRDVFRYNIAETHYRAEIAGCIKELIAKDGTGRLDDLLAVIDNPKKLLEAR